MPFELKSPYQDDNQTRTKTIGEILEKWIEDNWNVEDVPVDDIAFGKYGDELLSSGKSITLRCFTFHTLRNPYTVEWRRWDYQDAVNIDVYVLNNERTDGRDPRAIKTMKWLEELIADKENFPVGIYEKKLFSSDLRADPINTRFSHAVVAVLVKYLADVVEV